jgi:hypothetical protein
MQSDPLPWRPGAAWRSDATACLAVAAALAAVGQALATWQPTELQSGEPGWLLVAGVLYWRVGRGGRIAWWLLVTVATLATAVFAVSPLVAPVGFQLHRAVLYGAQVGLLVSPAVRRRLAGSPRAAAGAR